MNVDDHELCEKLSMCCGAEPNEYVDYFCGACNEATTFDWWRLEKCDECEEINMVKEPVVRSHVTVCDNCGSSSLAYDALVNDANEIVGGPYDNAQCLYCQDGDASTRKIHIEQAQSCGNGKDCDYIGTFDKNVMKGGLCPMCADTGLEIGTIWNLMESRGE